MGSPKGFGVPKSWAGVSPRAETVVPRAEHGGLKGLEWIHQGWT